MHRRRPVPPMGAPLGEREVCPAVPAVPSLLKSKSQLTGWAWDARIGAV